MPDRPTASVETVNIGIISHVDAGKTSLTERPLFDTDSGQIERRRGITIRSAVAAFTVGARQVNLIDTPGTATNPST